MCYPYRVRVRRIHGCATRSGPLLLVAILHLLSLNAISLPYPFPVRRRGSPGPPAVGAGGAEGPDGRHPRAVHEDVDARAVGEEEGGRKGARNSGRAAAALLGVRHARACAVCDVPAQM